jgi:mono/diheme cytochrome c family protein
MGPDLAGHKMAVTQFARAVRAPWGVMPSFTEKNITDPEIAQVAAYLSSLPKVSTPGPWRTPVPPNASHRQEIMIANGCGQCHGAVMGNPRRDAGGEGADFEWFKRYVYDHTETLADRPRVRMGNYSRMRIPEPFLQEIWQYVSVEAGFRVPVTARISAGTPGGKGVSYTLTVENAGFPGKGLTAENLTVALTLAPSTTVAETTGGSYQGVRHDAKDNTDAAVWQIARLAPGEKRTYTLTLSGSSAAAGIARGTAGWAKPPLGDGTTDQVAVAPPPRPAQTP